MPKFRQYGVGIFYSSSTDYYRQYWCSTFHLGSSKFLHIYGVGNLTRFLAFAFTMCFKVYSQTTLCDITIKPSPRNTQFSIILPASTWKWIRNCVGNIWRPNNFTDWLSFSIFYGKLLQISDLSAIHDAVQRFFANKFR